MDAALLEALARPGAFPSDPGPVEVRQTHISVVFLTPRYAYKLKKPLDLGFLDFTTLDKRLHFCREEVRLNRRLAPQVYLGVVPVTRDPHGERFKVEGEGEVVEWAVKMQRLPDEATLAERLGRNELETGLVETLACRIARFHKEADGGPEVAAHGRFEVVAHNARENFAQARGQRGLTLHPLVWERLTAANEGALTRLRPLLEVRARDGHVRDTHGDLHLDHVYYFPDKPKPHDLLVLDCVEFSDDYRCGDVVSDMAFFAMDLLFHDRPDLAKAFSAAYFGEIGDGQGRELLDFYLAYRAAVRGKVEGMEALEPEVPQDERDRAAERARAHWLLALGRLEPPARRPALVLVGGLPGTGKSRLAGLLERKNGFCRIATDEVRRELAGLAPEQSGAAHYGEGLYTPKQRELVYDECLRRAGEALFAGRRVVVEATFGREADRTRFLDLAARSGVPGLLLIRTATPEQVQERLAARRGGVSEADWAVYREAARRWEPFSDAMSPKASEIAAHETKEQAWESARLLLKARGLA